MEKQRWEGIAGRGHEMTYMPLIIVSAIISALKVHLQATQLGRASSTSGTSSVSLRGGLLFKQRGSSLEHATALSFLLLVYGRSLGQARRQVHCGETIVTPVRLTEFARSQVIGTCT
ncbi:hypothetical protein SLEP1_g53020 [Rubroshorea leprosula]|uniref:Secreted protein n=1 Tax=Rubroshorea leprosula TaxID=152421 RepID=A0AAV5MBJ4_9ROSI|nr:hypothetical protein SLEP1_g53020 [Rubroshorea leprosula]